MDSTDLSGGFWDSEEAEQEYYAVGQAISEAEEKLAGRLSVPQSRLRTLLAVYNYFAGAPGVAAVLRESNREWGDKKLNDALNPYWLPVPWFILSALSTDELRISPERPPDQWQGNLLVQSVERVTCRRKAVFNLFCIGRHGSYYEDYSFPFSFEGRVERYAPTGEVGMSRLEMELRAAFRQGTQQLDASGAGYLDTLMQEVQELLRPLRHQVVLTFYPDLGPAETEGEKQLRIHGCDYRNIRRYEKNIKSYLTWPPLTGYEAPKPGEYYGLASYKGICWVCHGRWKLYRFTQAQLDAVREKIKLIEQHLREQIVAAASGVERVEDEVNRLRKLREKLRVLHYKPLMFREFWSAMQITGQQDVD